MKPHVLVVRLDNEGDVLLTGPAVRAIAAGARFVTFLCGPRGRAEDQVLPESQRRAGASCRGEREQRDTQEGQDRARASHFSIVYQIGDVYARSCVVIGTSGGIRTPKRLAS